LKNHFGKIVQFEEYKHEKAYKSKYLQNFNIEQGLRQKMVGDEGIVPLFVFLSKTRLF
jgi:hypothetical protein